jgi:hypothetical protein
MKRIDITVASQDFYRGKWASIHIDKKYNARHGIG